MEKPNIKEVLELLQKKEAASKLYDEVETLSLQMLKKYGEGRFDYDLEDDIGDALPMLIEIISEMRTKGQYLKVEIEDNVRKMQDGEVLWKSVAVKPCSLQSKSLKRCPESLK